MTQVWGALLIFTICPLLGGLPLIDWITYALTKQRLRLLGTGNISVSAAFYHGGRLAGIFAVLSEALKGIVAVLLARAYFPSGSAWEMVALISLVMGRYWLAQGAGTTNVVWGYIVHDPIAAAFVFFIGGIGFTILRERRQGRFGILVLFPLITALRHGHDQALVVAAATLAFLLGWIYTKIPDDLDLSTEQAKDASQSMFQFFRGDRAIRSLDHPLQTRKAGQKAATLARLKRLGYPVPTGWVLIPGDDPEPLLQALQPSPQHPLVVRSSAVGEDTETASAAGQYETVLSVTRQEEIMPAISRCLASYDAPTAVQYRRDRGLPEAQMAVLIQRQVRGVFSGVAFSRDPISRQGEAVVIEALPGNASQVVSGQVTPESYRVLVPDAHQMQRPSPQSPSWLLPEELTLDVEGNGEIPPRLLQQVAYLARHLEAYYHSIPQDMEWSYDGQTLWLLQTRPITTLQPIWTRKIAAEVIPGLIRPLTWSINRPLTCGVWGEIFTIVLANRATGLNFNETATLHYSRAYFNASLLGQIFRRMGLPAESLEFLTRGAKFNKPPLLSTFKNVPGLLRLAGRERTLEQDFQRDYRHRFAPALAALTQLPADQLPVNDLLARVDQILDLLRSATYYSILAPLSAALRQAIWQVPAEQLDNRDTPEVAALRSLQELAHAARQQLGSRLEGEDAETGGRGEGELGNAPAKIQNPKSKIFSTLAGEPEGQAILAQLDQLLDRYGYLSEVGTDIAIPTWKEDPQIVQELFAQFCLDPLPTPTPPRFQSGKVRRVQRRISLKGKVTEVYSRLLAELRWSFVALEQHWLKLGWLEQVGDLFFLSLDEIRQFVRPNGSQAPTDRQWVRDVVGQRRAHWEQDRRLETVPYLVYGDDPPEPIFSPSNGQATQQFQGIGASPGQAEGRVQVVRSLANGLAVGKDTILVVPYTDSGWAPLLAKAGGLIAEVGGKLSHGAIVAREYRIPAVMDIPNATNLLRDGQRVRIDGQRGIVEIL